MADRRMNGKGGMTVSEAGRKGGERVRDERGVGFYQEIGRKGGELGGRKGGEAVRDKYGPSLDGQIGHKGGQKVRELIEQGKRLGRAAKGGMAEESDEEGRAPSGGAGMNSGRGGE